MGSFASPADLHATVRLEAQLAPHFDHYAVRAVTRTRLGEHTYHHRPYLAPSDGNVGLGGRRVLRTGDFDGRTVPFSAALCVGNRRIDRERAPFGDLFARPSHADVVFPSREIGPDHQPGHL